MSMFDLYEKKESMSDEDRLKRIKNQYEIALYEKRLKKLQNPRYVKVKTTIIREPKRPDYKKAAQNIKTAYMYSKKAASIGSQYAKKAGSGVSKFLERAKEKYEASKSIYK